MLNVSSGGSLGQLESKGGEGEHRRSSTSFAVSVDSLTPTGAFDLSLTRALHFRDLCSSVGLIMKASLLLVCTLAGLALSGSMQTMSDSAIAEPLRLLLEVRSALHNTQYTILLIFVQVTKRSRELAYDLEKQVASSLNDGRMLASGLEGELARLVAATSNLTALTSVVGPGALTDKYISYINQYG